MPSVGHRPPALEPHDGRMDEHVKIRFALERDSDGWPPAESEGLWARPVADDLFRLDGVPWFVRDVANEDTVRARQDDGGMWWFVEHHERSGRITVRVIPDKQGPLAGSREAVLATFLGLGIDGEGMASPVNMVALDIPPTANIEQAKAVLVAGEADGRWFFEEGSVTESWRALPS
jgi:hypothetical protein